MAITPNKYDNKELGSVRRTEAPPRPSSKAMPPAPVTKQAPDPKAPAPERKG